MLMGELRPTFAARFTAQASADTKIKIAPCWIAPNLVSPLEPGASCDRVGAIDETRKATDEARTKSACARQAQHGPYAQPSHPLRRLRSPHRRARVLERRCAHGPLSTRIDVALVLRVSSANGRAPCRTRPNGSSRTYCSCVALSHRHS